MIYEFEIPGQIIGKARPRMNTRTGQAYTPSKTKNYEFTAKQWFAIKYPRFETLEGRIKVTIIAYFDIPKSTSKKKEVEMLNQNISPTKKPDIDNITKIVLDSMNKIAFKDDTQVTELVVEKRYSKEEKLHIRIEEY